MALFSVSIALLLWHLDALTIPLFEYRSSVFPLDVVVVECPRVGWHQIALESAGGPRLLGLVDAAPAPGARGAASLTLYFMSDCYLGVDLQYEFTLEVRPSE